MRRVWLAFGCILVALSAFVWILIINQYSYMAELTDLVTRRGVLYREEFIQELQMLTSRVHLIEAFSLVLFLSGAFCLAMSISKPTDKTRTALTVALLLLLTPLTIRPVAAQEVVVYNPRAKYAKVIYLYGGFQRIHESASAIVTVADNDVQASWVAFPIGVGNPITREWIEVGYFEDTTGHYLYSSKNVGGTVSEIIIGSTSPGLTYNFTVISIGTYATVQINSAMVNSMTFYNVERLEYILLGETIYPYNSMNQMFDHPLVGYWKFDDSIINSDYSVNVNGLIYVRQSWLIDYTSIVNRTPYVVTCITASPEVQSVLINGQLEPGEEPPVGGGGGSGMQEYLW